MGRRRGTMEVMEITDGFWKDKKVLVKGHNGFKGSWLSLLLSNLGAKVIGASIKIPSEPALFHQAKISEHVTDLECDIRDLDSLKNIFRKHSPEIVFHLAAQPLAGYSFENPIETSFLKLDCTKSYSRLGWSPIWDIHKTIEAIANWYKAENDKDDIYRVTMNQINNFLDQIDH